MNKDENSTPVRKVVLGAGRYHTGEQIISLIRAADRGDIELIIPCYETIDSKPPKLFAEQPSETVLHGAEHLFEQDEVEKPKKIMILDPVSSKMQEALAKLQADGQVILIDSMSQADIVLRDRELVPSVGEMLDPEPIAFSEFEPKKPLWNKPYPPTKKDRKKYRFR